MIEQPMVTSDELAAYRDGDDALLIRSATARVRSICGWHVAPVITTTVEVDGGAVLELPTLRLVELVSVTNARDGSQTAAPTVFHAGSSGIVVASPTSTVDERWWQDRRLRLLVTFKHGHDSAPDVEEVILALAARASDNPLGATREQAGPFSTSPIPAEPTDGELAKLAPYVLGPLP